MLRDFIRFWKCSFNLRERRYLFVLFSIYISFILLFTYFYFRSYKKDLHLEQDLIYSYQKPVIESMSKYTFISLKKFADLKNNVKKIIYVDLDKNVIIIDNKTIPFIDIKSEDITKLLKVIKQNKNTKFFYEILPYFNYGKQDKTICFFKKINDHLYKIYVFNPDKIFNLLEFVPSTIKIKINVGSKTLFESTKDPVFRYEHYKYFVGNLPLTVHIGLVKNKKLESYEQFEEKLMEMKLLLVLGFVVLLTILNTILLYKENKFVDQSLRKLREKLENISKILESHFENPYLETFIPKFLKVIKNIFQANKVYFKLLSNQSYYIDENNNIKPIDPNILKDLSKHLKENKRKCFQKDGKYYFYCPLETKKQVLGFLLLERDKPLHEIDQKLLEIITYALGSALDSELKLEDIFYLIANIIEARDPYTKGHSLRVAHYAKWIAKKMGLPQDVCEKIFKAGMLHDIGKIGIPDIVLLKPGKLTDQEYETMKLHAEFSYYIINSVSSLKEFATIARYHHERWDGKGYPKGLKGEEIPLEARILAVADAIDAMTSTRPYRKALSFEKAKEELLYNAGKQFDPKIISTILPYIDELKAIKSAVDMQIEKFLPEEVEKLRSYVFFHDPTTGCYQITAFLKELDNLIVKEEEFCLALIDVKNLLDFIEKNNFDVADQILAKIAQIIQEYTSLVARDSDMFFFVIKDRDCQKVLDEIKNKIKEKLNIDVHSVLVKYCGEKKSGHKLLVDAIKKLKESKKEKGEGQ